MLRLGLLSAAVVLLYATGAQAHGYHGDCRVGSSWMGTVPHWHPGGYGRGYYQSPPPYYGPGYQGGGYYQPTPPIIGPGYRRW